MMIYITACSLLVQVSLVGHSAGAQMCTMALLNRAKALSRASQPGSQNMHEAEEERMPAKLIGMRHHTK